MKKNPEKQKKATKAKNDAEEQLRTTSQLYRAVVEDQTELICRWKPGRILTFVNPAYCRFFGKKPEQLIGTDFLTLIPKQDHPSVKQHLNSLGADNPIITHEHRVILPSGEIRWHEWTNRAIMDPKARIKEFQSVGRDITKRKRNEMALRMSEQCFKAVADYTYFWEIWVSPDGRPLWTNPAVKRVTGYSVKELLEIHDYPLPLIYEHDREKVRRAFQSALKGTKGREFQFRIRKKDGSIIWAEASWQPIYDEKGSSLGHRQSIRDITERKNAQHALEMSEKRFRDLALTTSDWLWEVDSDARYTYCSPRVADVLGYSTDEVLRKTPFEFMTPEDAQRVTKIFKQLVQNHQPIVDLENWNISKDHRKVCLLTNGVPILDQNENLTGYRGVDKDITKKKLAEKYLQNRTEQLEKILNNASKKLRKPSVELDTIERDLQQYCQLITNQLTAETTPPKLGQDARKALKADIPKTLESLRAAAANIAQILNSLTPSGESKQNS